jgi:glycosyltransferase involved in cell wall biosynthesis
MNSLIKITAITGGINEPSARFRVRQYIKGLEYLNIKVIERIPFISKSGKYWYHRYPFLLQLLPQLGTAGLRMISRIPAIVESYNSDITWIQREFLTAFSTIEGLTKNPRIFDVDDAIWLRCKFTSEFAKKVVRKMDGVICGNEWIANYFSDCRVPIWVIPTGVDVAKWTPSLLIRDPEKNFFLGWTGTSSNYQYLYEIEKPLVYFFKKYPSAKLLIISDQKPNFLRLSEKNIQFLYWSKEIEVQAVQQMDVGLMPLKNNDWEKGKCAFKMLLYMATQIPVIVSPVGMNKDVLKKDIIGFSPKSHTEWFDALVTLRNDTDLRHQMGTAGRIVVENNYSLKQILPQLADIFRKIII